MCLLSSSNRAPGSRVGLGAFLLICILGASAWMMFVAIGTDWDAWLGTLGVYVVAPLVFTRVYREGKRSLREDDRGERGSGGSTGPRASDGG